MVASIENAITSTTDELSAHKERPQWWNAALTLGHLESKMHAAKALESPTEYKQALLLYARKLGEEGFRSKAEELIKDLFGPVYWCVSCARHVGCDLPDAVSGIRSERMKAGHQRLLGWPNVTYFVRSCLCLVCSV